MLLRLWLKRDWRLRSARLHFGVSTFHHSMSAAAPSLSLFSEKLISAEVQSRLPSGFLLRPLQSTDYQIGYLEALSHLTTVGNISHAQFLDRFQYLRSHSNEYFLIVIEDRQKQRIAAAGTLFVERKFIHENGLVGHLEDIVVHKDYRKLNFGRFIIDQLTFLGRVNGCYKILLDCSEKNVPFYEKCGYTRKGAEMACYMDVADKQPVSKL